MAARVIVAYLYHEELPRRASGRIAEFPTVELVRNSRERTNPEQVEVMMVSLCSSPHVQKRSMRELPESLLATTDLWEQIVLTL